MNVNCYETDLAICEGVFNQFVLSTNFFGFITIGLLAKYASEKRIYSGDFKLLVRERGYDLKARCDERGVYFSRSCTKALSNEHPVKLLRCAQIQSVINQKGVKGALSQLKIKRSVIDQLLYEMIGVVEYRTKFQELGWSICSLPYLTTPLYRVMVKYIVDEQLRDKKSLHDSIIQDMNEGKKWWLNKHPKCSVMPGFIYLAILAEDTSICHVKVGQTEREIKTRHSEHLRCKKIDVNTTFLCKYVSSPIEEESSILSYLKRNGQLVKGREEFVVSRESASILKQYLVNDVSFAEFIMKEKSK
jgi:hypothetical protein